ncbi:cytochrome b/b6 domain-containing protein [Cochlodiniinecator piscidefendens]|uniref:cytochrome b/b6 domain-containing protein n=1 Tax=Cochlodiniinecator piscidefendens TaxID=2715756 RepID=UPI00140A933A|nr:cytochrome b/b6 domain-containing protein [Cochlodiniinecator piscidefendens]
MSLSNSKSRYGVVTKSFHWVTALLIITLIPLGIIAHNAPFATSEELNFKATLFQIHKTLGVLVFFVALARIMWALSQPKPGLLNAENRLEAFAAETVHWLLYSALVLVPLTGWIHHAATTGFAPIWWPFSQNLPFVPKDEGVAHLFSALHFTFERVLAFSLVLHILGAIKHHVIDKDATLRRMLPGTPKLPEIPEQHHSKAPIFAALTAYLCALVAGAFLWYLPGLEHEAPVQVTLEEGAQGNWQVEEGTISITVRQFGSDVTGSFADWTATIQFDETVGLDPAGEVEVQIAIPTLTLGSVTDQAMGADFFNVAEFPTAEFAATLHAVPDGYEARGTLSIKGTALPITLPFGLRIDGDRAEMNGNTTLQRLDFNVGTNMPDESSLGFTVDVSIDLTALRRQ